MKRLCSLLLLIAIISTLVACAAQPSTRNTPSPNIEDGDPGQTVNPTAEIPTPQDTPEPTRS